MTHPPQTPPPAKPTRAILVSHTHWDRAWYVPFEIYRIRLVRLIDRLLDLLDGDPGFRCFTLDGQTLPVDDYLEIRPERRSDLERLVRAGRLSVGPWYILPDEYLVSPEALIRNLMIGLHDADALGGVMRVGYAPDAFGHVGQLPQILRGFGIDSAIFWRGAGDEMESLGSEFWWEAPGGRARVLAVHLREGYGNVANLGYPIGWGDPTGQAFGVDRALTRLREVVDQLRAHTRAGAVLLMNGTDHLEAHPHIPEAIAQANEAFPDVKIEHGAFRDYVDHVRAVAGDALPAFRGEFNRSRYAFGLQGVYSSRMYLNQANERAQTLLECYAEPLSAWAWLLGAPYPARFLDLAWRKLLQNHPHDDICGCSADAVHRENMVRFDQVGQIGSTLARNACRAIMRRIDRTAQAGTPFVLFNPTPWSRSGTVEVELAFERDDETVQDPAGFHLVDAAGQVVPHQALDGFHRFETEVGKSSHLHVVRAALSLESLPACGYRVYYAVRGPAPALPGVEAPVRITEHGMENRYLHVEIRPDGTLDVLDKESGRTFHELGYYVDDEDAGDTYDYSPCPSPERLSTRGEPASIRRLHAGPLQAAYEIAHAWALPASLTSDRQRRSAELVPFPITTTITLRHDSRRLELRTTVDNRARDHRLRVHVPTGINTDTAHADGHFDVLARSIDLPTGAGWDQPPVPTRHQRYFVDLSDGETGLAVLNRGLAEYEVLRDGERNTVAITLLRCVGYLSRGDGDMPTRPNLAGPPLPTPEAQCPGTHTFDYALVFHPGDWRAIYRDACRYRAPLYVRRGDEHPGYSPTSADIEVWGAAALPRADLHGDLAGELSFLSVLPAPVALSAVKRDARDERLVVRLYNPGEQGVEAELRMFLPARGVWEVNLNEEIVRELSIPGAATAIRVPIAGKEVKTLALALDTRATPARP